LEKVGVVAVTMNPPSRRNTVASLCRSRIKKASFKSFIATSKQIASEDAANTDFGILQL
jgi:hypothetical protein